MKIKIIRRGTIMQPNSAQTVASIDDLLIQILLRLPIKSLIRFRFVSKHWHSLITSPKFRSLRHCCNPNPAIGLFLPCYNSRVKPEFAYLSFSTNQSTIPPFRILEFTKDPFGINILQSCNGLLLCSSTWANGSSMRLYVYNPSTTQFSTLPEINRPVGMSSAIRGMSLAFDPIKSPDYNIVCVLELDLASGERRNQIQIYSSQTSSWRVIGEPFNKDTNFENGVYWNGAIHWIGENGDSLYFNIAHQVLDKMPMPPVGNEREVVGHHYFGESYDHLHYIDICNSPIQFNVYEMKKDYSEWFVKYQVDLSEFVAAGMIGEDPYPGERICYDYSIYCIIRGEQEEDSFLVLHFPGKAIRYNLVSKSFEQISKSEDAQHNDSLRFPSTHGFQYIESLCCL